MPRGARGVLGARRGPPAAARAEDWTLVNRTPKDKARAFVTDRPGNTDSPQTVPAGWFQVEADIISYIENSDGLIRTETFEIGSTNFGLKAGLTDNVDVHLIVFPYTRTEIGAGPDGATVVFEVDKDDPSVVERLERSFAARHGR